ncbi:efflux RND transporter periplasmic adaptor subunit [Afifella sp. IM 167]|uniref:efflux RND transporter periplasmic adaptor subunit n=1 Tax=Afifella sp. IM 167 TaxID=2033586 RepID=UPI001CCEA5E3|nr:efflux RND transporter periplasmic adaptor subunit [Afifella sp. IM 167]MBZ8134216.1 efflux transporter periplasmic adaptor subunit [Afifella sp. IM 167]
MRIRFSYILATALAAGVSYYMLTGRIIIGGEPETAPQPIAEAERADEAPPKVQVEPHEAVMRVASLAIRGRTEAENLVEVKAQTGGIVEKRPVHKGQEVEPDALLCVIERGAREAQLAQAKAKLAQAKVDIAAQEALASKGYAAKNQIPAMQAAVNAAEASVAEAELELKRTEVRAPIGGTLQDPIANVGDVVALGGTCATIIDADPMKMIGQVSEQEIAAVHKGQKANVTLITGESAEGTVTYIATSADAQTRTFRVEISVPNPQGTIRDGLTAVAQIPLGGKKAQLVSSSYLTLSDEGEVGVRTVEDGIVHFRPVEIVGDAPNGLWVSGLADEVDIITVGQEFVTEGGKVDAMAAQGAPMRPRQTAEIRP